MQRYNVSIDSLAFLGTGPNTKIDTDHYIDTLAADALIIASGLSNDVNSGNDLQCKYICTTCEWIEYLAA